MVKLRKGVARGAAKRMTAGLAARRVFAIEAIVYGAEKRRVRTGSLEEREGLVVCGLKSRESGRHER